MHQAIRKVRAKVMPAGRLFQSDKDLDKKGNVYDPGLEHRSSNQSDRPVLSEPQRNMVRVISDMIDEKYGKCKDRCLIPIELQEHLGHFSGMIKEMSHKNEIEDGLNKWSDQNKRTKSLFKWYDAGTSITFKVIVVVAITGIITILALGFWQKINQGGV